MHNSANSAESLLSPELDWHSTVWVGVEILELAELGRISELGLWPWGEVGSRADGICEAGFQKDFLNFDKALQVVSYNSANPVFAIPHTITAITHPELVLWFFLGMFMISATIYVYVYVCV
jgi:hypothetical protein